MFVLTRTVTHEGHRGDRAIQQLRRLTPFCRPHMQRFHFVFPTLPGILSCTVEGRSVELPEQLMGLAVCDFVSLQDCGATDCLSRNDFSIDYPGRQIIRRSTNDHISFFGATMDESVVLTLPRSGVV